MTNADVEAAHKVIIDLQAEYLERSKARTLLADIYDLLERLAEDAKRYQWQFSTGQWDYHYKWLGANKAEVDALIDAAIARKEKT